MSGLRLRVWGSGVGLYRKVFPSEDCRVAARGFGVSGFRFGFSGLWFGDWCFGGSGRRLNVFKKRRRLIDGLQQSTVDSIDD